MVRQFIGIPENLASRMAIHGRHPLKDRNVRLPIKARAKTAPNHEAGYIQANCFAPTPRYTCKTGAGHTFATAAWAASLRREVRLPAPTIEPHPEERAKRASRRVWLQPHGLISRE